MTDLTKPASFWQFHNQDSEVASSVISNVLSPMQFSPLGPDGAFQHSIQIVQIDDIILWHSTSSTGFSVTKQMNRSNIFELNFLKTGRCSTITNDVAIETNPGEALLLKDFNKHEMFCEPDTQLVCIVVPAARYSKIMAAEFADPLADLSGMRPVANSHNANIQSLKQIANLVLSLGRAAPSQENASTAALLLFKGLLILFAESWPRSVAHPTNYSVRPFYIKRAMEWMQSHAAEKITLEQLATVSGVSRRTLQLGFQNFCGLSPMAFLLKVRLQKAYRDLVTEPPSVTIDEISRRWGFSNPGKFAADIRDSYGENPLVIRRRYKAK
ncbi:hypothetical protein RU07_01755 [Agrobacterium tumefaciens]|uniref:HTH araC/xylS-type domain-containing protein n=1 Tax=Agrobacterium tumefaciens TaxID=358 RepID=A0A0D0KZS2_AGRTU|nr:hypothetical protein RU07_01755 [Agrobacterium tumefaciens]